MHFDATHCSQHCASARVRSIASAPSSQNPGPELEKAVPKPRADDSAFQGELASAHFRLGRFSPNSGMVMPLLRQTKKPITVIWPQLGGSLNNLGVLLAKQGKFDETLPMYERAVEYTEQAFGRGPHSILCGCWLCACLGNLAETRAKLGQEQDALAWYRSSRGRRSQARVRESGRHQRAGHPVPGASAVQRDARADPIQATGRVT